MKEDYFMGMRGYYIAVDECIVNQILDNEISLLEIDPSQYESLDIDESWQAIHYLLCREIENGAPPLGYVVPMKESNYIESELEYGAYYLQPHMLKEAYDGIKNLTEEDLQNMFDISLFAENRVYPFINREDEKSFFEYLLFHFLRIRAFFEKLAAKDHGCIFFVS